MYQNNTKGSQGYYPQDSGHAIPIAQPINHGGDISCHVQPMKPTNPPATGWRDLPFAILFFVNVAAMVALLVIWGIPALKGESSTSSSSSNASFLSSKNTKTIIGMCVILSGIAVVLSLAMLKLIVTYASCMITFSLWFSVVLSFAFAAYAAVKHQYVLAVIGVVFALLSLCYAYMVRNRIPFAVANLKVAAGAINKHGSTYCVAFVMLFVQVAWVFVWAFALLGVTNHLGSNSDNNASGFSSGSYCVRNSQCASNVCSNNACTGTASLKNTSYVAYFFMLVSFYWGMEVFKNISHATIAGTVASWWYSADSKGATGASFKRSCTTSLGSICLGSLIVAIISALRQLAEEARRDGSAAACIAECILGCLESLMQYFNRWAFVYVGIYGYKFTEAGKAVFSLFGQRGFDAIINDDLIGNALGFASLAVGLLCAGLALAYHYIDTTATNFASAEYILPILGLFVGVGISVIPLSVVDSAVATVFVCFAEDPAALAVSHPEYYQSLVVEWHRMYPDVMVAAGYYV